MTTELRILPDPDRIFAPIKQAIEKHVHVVILGQDPYPSVDPYGTPKAYGNAFAYNPKYRGRISSSMYNILIELGAYSGFDTSLQHWIDQGVLLLNTELTVGEGKPLSHKGAWTRTVNATLTLVENRDEPVYVAWGTAALKVLTRLGIPKERIVHTSHPCKYSARAGKQPFLGSKWHEKVNVMLEAQGMRAIDWYRYPHTDYAIDIASALVDQAVRKGIVREDTGMLIFDSLVDGLRARSIPVLLSALQEITHESGR
jgi:uracil-DNA glycosylase